MRWGADSKINIVSTREATVAKVSKEPQQHCLKNENISNFYFHREPGFAAAKTTNDDVVGDATEINSAIPQNLVVENQHINPPEEPELMANTD
ncbi:hypothetical protein TNCV_2547611 [Trichonephila clavipes]|nr:hypothetical protein TNCV_2547611 [Trichonephila clavipes]